MEKNFGPKEQPKLLRMFRRSLDDVCGQFKIELDSGTQFDLVFTTPGLGDGEYPVFSVVQAGEIVGVELVFLGKECLGWEKTIRARRIPAAT
jgi:hypothetical protein